MEKKEGYWSTWKNITNKMVSAIKPKVSKKAEIRKKISLDFSDF